MARRTELAVDRMRSDVLWRQLDSRLAILESWHTLRPVGVSVEQYAQTARQMARELRLRGEQMRLPIA
jgi:hypothetical protein